jgi:hypothetical protein
VRDQKAIDKTGRYVGQDWKRELFCWPWGCAFFLLGMTFAFLQGAEIGTLTWFFDGEVCGGIVVIGGVLAVGFRALKNIPGVLDLLLKSSHFVRARRLELPRKCLLCGGTA